MARPEDFFAAGVFQAIVARAAPRLDKALKERGASDPSELPRNLANEILIQTLTDVAATEFPGANINALTHGLLSFTHPRFSNAMSRVRRRIDEAMDAFQPVEGIDAAIVLAGLGLSVAPFDKKNPRVLAKPSNDIDIVASNFAKWKTAYVAYSACAAPFYILLTDCVATLHRKTGRDPRLKHVKTLFDRDNQPVPDYPARFRHGMVVFARKPEDQVETVLVWDSNPDNGSIWLSAGWIENGEPLGAPNDGYVPVPMQFLRAALEDPGIAMWIWHPVGTRAFVH